MMGTFIRMSDGLLPKRIMSRNLEGVPKKRWGGKKKEWVDCVINDVRVFGIVGDWKEMALEAGVWIVSVTEGVRRFMAAGCMYVCSYGQHLQRVWVSPVFAGTFKTCSLHTNSGCGKERRKLIGP